MLGRPLQKSVSMADKNRLNQFVDASISQVAQHFLFNLIVTDIGMQFHVTSREHIYTPYQYIQYISVSIDSTNIETQKTKIICRAFL